MDLGGGIGGGYGGSIGGGAGTPLGALGGSGPGQLAPNSRPYKAPSRPSAFRDGARGSESEPNNAVAEEELEDENSVMDGSYMGRASGKDDQNDISAEPILSETVRDTITITPTITDADKS